MTYVALEKEAESRAKALFSPMQVLTREFLLNTVRTWDKFLTLLGSEEATWEFVLGAVKAHETALCNLLGSAEFLKESAEERDKLLLDVQRVIRQAHVLHAIIDVQLDVSPERLAKAMKLAADADSAGAEEIARKVRISKTREA